MAQESTDANYHYTHYISGDNEVSKVGTKHAALSCEPLMLTNFAETNTLSDNEVFIAEHYLVNTYSAGIDFMCQTHNIGIQMNRKELTKTSMMILN